MCSSDLAPRAAAKPTRVAGSDDADDDLDSDSIDDSDADSDGAPRAPGTAKRKPGRPATRRTATTTVRARRAFSIL